MLRFWKVTLANLKVGKLFHTLATSSFYGLFMNKFLFEVKSLFFVEIYSKRRLL